MTAEPISLVVLDRDGVINQDSDAYIKSPDEWQPIPGSPEAIARLNDAGIRVAVVTNQSGIARGYYDLETLAAIHRKMLETVAAAGGHIEQIFFCPHGPDDGCDCRKPSPGLLLQAAEYFACGFPHMVFIGDKESDLQTAATVGCSAVLVRTGNGEKTAAAIQGKPDYADVDIYTDLATAVDALIEGNAT